MALDARLGRDDGEVTYWPVFSDVALSMFFIVLLYVVVQFLDFDKLVVLEQLQRRHREVDSLLKADISDTYRGQLSVVSLDPYRQRVTFRSDALFPVCRATLTDRGRVLLLEVGRILGSRASYFDAVQIEGHTDKVPTGAWRDCPYPTNWELSSERATTVVRLLSERGKLAGTLLSAIGRAEFHPVPGAEDADSASLTRNRRIELTLQYSEGSVRRALESPANGNGP